MNVPPVLYGALGGAVVTSLLWMVSKPAESRQTIASPAVEQPLPTAPRAEQLSPTAISDWSPQFPAGTRPGDVSPIGASTFNRNAEAKPLPPRAAERSAEPTPARPAAPPTRDELYARAAKVERHANVELEALAQRLDLTEEQQDRIFPVLARSAPAFHPVLQPEGGNAVFGDGTSIAPGAPIAEIESEIFPELDQFQQAALADEAIDREAWWEEIVGQLESDLENSTNVDVVTGTDDGNSQPTGEFTDEERNAAAATNEATDFSDLLFGN